MAVFLVLGVVGLAILAVSLLVGEIHGGLFEALDADWFSTEVVGAFVSALGFGGAIAVGAGAPDVVSVVVGIAAGVVFRAGAASLTRLVRGGSTDEAPTADDTVGREGRVLTAVPEEGFGAVEIWVGGHTLRFNARSDDAIAPGTRIHVTAVLSPTAVQVAPVWSALPPA